MDRQTVGHDTTGNEKWDKVVRKAEKRKRQKGE